jgi:hypothetical protein
MENGPQSPTGLDIVNFPSQLEKHKERGREHHTRNVKSQVASMDEGNLVRRLEVALGCLLEARDGVGDETPTMGSAVVGTLPNKWNGTPNR